MLEFTTFLESLRSPFRWRITTDNRREYEAHFVTNEGIEYVVLIQLLASVLGKNSTCWLEFAVGDGGASKGVPKGSHGVTGTGEAFQVFSTVIDILRDFVKKHEPAMIKFSALEPSRIKLYSRLVDMVASELPGYYGARETDGRTFFIKRSLLGGSLNPLR
jgi:hypothetical protein